MDKIWYSLARFAFMFALASASGACSAKERVSPLRTTFLEDVNIESKKENLPFDHAWVSEKAAQKNYSKLFIKPVRVDKLPGDEWDKSRSVVISSKEDYEKSAQEIAIYFSNQLREKLLAQPERRFTLVDNAGSDTIVAEIAFTELEFSHPIARAGALAAPVPGASQALNTVSNPHVAFAARLTDGETGQLLATVADRKFPPRRPIDLNKLSASSSAREVCALWAESLADAIQAKPGKEVSEENFSLSLW